MYPSLTKLNIFVSFLGTPWSEFSNFLIEYIGKIKTEFENTLACLSGALMSSNRGKNRGRKFRGTLVLKKRTKNLFVESKNIFVLSFKKSVPREKNIKKYFCIP